jgi:hypothetical protein
MRTVVFVIACSVAAFPAVADQPTMVLSESQNPVERSIPDGPDTALNQPPNQVNGSFSDVSCDICGGTQILGEDFLVSTGGAGYQPDQITIWGGFFPNDTPVPVIFDIIFYPDTGGVPGGSAACFATGISPTSDTLTGVSLFGVSEHEFVLTISGCTLTDGAYWLVLYTDTGAGTDDFFWEVGDVDAVNGFPGSAVAFDYPAVTWSPDSTNNFSVLITGTILPVELQSFSIE